MFFFSFTFRFLVFVCAFHFFSSSSASKSVSVLRCMLAMVFFYNVLWHSIIFLLDSTWFRAVRIQTHTHTYTHWESISVFVAVILSLRTFFIHCFAYLQLCRFRITSLFFFLLYNFGMYSIFLFSSFCFVIILPTSWCFLPLVASLETFRVDSLSSLASHHDYYCYINSYTYNYSSFLSFLFHCFFFSHSF